LLNFIFNFKGRVVLLIIGLIFFIGFFSSNSAISQATPSTTNHEKETSTHSTNVEIDSLTLAKTPFMIGRSYFSQGKYDEAIIEFEKSIELDVNHTESYYYLGQCYLQKASIEYNNKNMLKFYRFCRKSYEASEKVIPQYEKMIEDNPEDLNSYLKLGYIYEIRSIVPFINEYDKALDYYLRALGVLDLLEESSLSASSARNTGISIYLNTRIGYLYFEKKKYSRAIEYLERAEKISPHNIEAAYYLGVIGKFFQKITIDITGLLRCRGLASAFSIHGDLIFGNSANELRGFIDKARETSKGSIPFKILV